MSVNTKALKNIMISFPDIGKTDDKVTLPDITFSLKASMVQLADKFFEIGEKLSFIQDYKLYSPTYKNLLEYSSSEFGLSKNQTYNFINVFKKFNYPQYKDFQYSNLVEMLNMSDEQLKKVSSNTTVKELREIKKEDKIKSLPKKENDNKLLEKYVSQSDEIKKLKGLLDYEKSLNSQIRECNRNLESYIDENIKRNTFEDYQYKLLDFFIDNYWEVFVQDYQSKFDKSKKLEKSFGIDKIDIALEMGKIHEKIGGIING